MWWGGRKNWISVMRLSKFLSSWSASSPVKCPKCMLGRVLERETNYGNDIAEIGGKKNCGNGIAKIEGKKKCVN